MMSWRLAGPRDRTTSPALSMDPDPGKPADDALRIPAAAASLMERSMMQLLNKAQEVASGGSSSRVRGLMVVFSHEGHASVKWEFHGSSDEIDP